MEWFNLIVSGLNTNSGAISAIATVIVAGVTYFYTSYTKKLLLAQEELLSIQQKPNLVFTRDVYGYSCIYNLSVSTILIHEVMMQTPINGRKLPQKLQCVNPGVPKNTGYMEDSSQSFEKYVVFSGDHIRLYGVSILNQGAPYGAVISFNDKQIVKVKFSYSNTAGKLRDIELNAVSYS